MWGTLDCWIRFQFPFPAHSEDWEFLLFLWACPLINKSLLYSILGQCGTLLYGNIHHLMYLKYIFIDQDFRNLLFIICLFEIMCNSHITFNLMASNKKLCCNQKFHVVLTKAVNFGTFSHFLSLCFRGKKHMRIWRRPYFVKCGPRASQFDFFQDMLESFW